jgi:hypothetical protein
MRDELIAELRKRNARIIAAIIKKAHAVCPGSIASKHLKRIIYLEGE